MQSYNEILLVKYAKSPINNLRITYESPKIYKVKEGSSLYSMLGISLIGSGNSCIIEKKIVTLPKI